jgi:hypothetical protein
LALPSTSFIEQCRVVARKLVDPKAKPWDDGVWSAVHHALAPLESGVDYPHHRLRAEHLLMKDDHREKAIVALTRFRKEVREAGFSEDELSDILGHISALEQEVKAPKPDQAVLKSSTDALDEVTHSPDVTDAIARVVRFFNSIGIQ